MATVPRSPLSVIAVLTALSLACSKPPPAAAPEAAPVAEPMPEPDPDDVHIEGDHLVIDDHINFAFDSDQILEVSSSLMEHIALLLSHHNEIVSVEIVGHTDAAGGHEHNQELSERRAAAVLSTLRSLGVTQQMSSRGVGELEPVCAEDTDECHATNRRVEFIIAMN